MKGKGKAHSKSKKAPTDTRLKKVGERIRQLRMQKGYSSYEYFAYDHNISRAQFGRYEQGQDMRLSSLMNLADAFGITLEEFFKEGFD